MIGDGMTETLFEIDENTGIIRLRTNADLTGDTEVKYVVSSIISLYLHLLCWWFVISEMLENKH